MPSARSPPSPISTDAGITTTVSSMSEPERPPSVDRLARSLTDTGLPHPLLVDVARRAIAGGDPSTVEDRARADATAIGRTLLQPVINATGVLLHTNLGRAPFAPALYEGYTNLEL